VITQDIKYKKELHIKMRMGKRGQTSTEFLMTYGWAILVVLILIVAFVYLNVVRPKQLIVDQCLMPPGLACLDSKISESDGITLTVENAMKRTLQYMNITITECGNEKSSQIDDTFKDGERYNFNFSCSTYVVEGEALQSDLIIEYITGVGNNRVPHVIKGRLVGQIEP
jgi:uncharacterized protein (UPF0333 family)